MKRLFSTVVFLATTLAGMAQMTPEEKLNMTLYAVINLYVDSVDKSKFVDYHISNMMKSLDPFSEYLAPESAKQGEMLFGDNIPQSEGKTQTLQHKTDAKTNAPYCVNAAYMADNTTGYISLSMFGQSSADEVRESIRELKKQGMKSLIIDLQQNGGGLVDKAVEIADEFLSKDLTVFTARGKNVPEKVFKTSRKGMFERGRLSVLIGSGTKSAAELFAAALKDHDRALITGKRSFGKGLIQETLPFADGSALRITVARYFTPKGVCIQKPYIPEQKADWGVKPDIEVAPDTLHRSSMWYNIITFSGVQTLIARTYAQEHETELRQKYTTEEDFIRHFDSLSIFNKVLAKSDELGYERSDDDMAKCKDYVVVQLKALVGRHLYGNNCFFRVMNERNNALRQALASQTEK